MKDFLKENWFYILAPIVVVLVLMVVLVFMTGGEEEGAPFIYNIF